MERSVWTPFGERSCKSSDGSRRIRSASVSSTNCAPRAFKMLIERSISSRVIGSYVPVTTTVSAGGGVVCGWGGAGDCCARTNEVRDKRSSRIKKRNAHCSLREYLWREHSCLQRSQPCERFLRLAAPDGSP